MKQQIKTDEAPKAENLLSQAIVINGLIFVSGQIHNMPDGTMIHGSTKDKVSQIIKNVSTILEAANAGLKNVVKVTIYVTDIALVPEINAIYPSFFTDPLPAREAICVQALPLGASIEISVIAAA